MTNEEIIEKIRTTLAEEFEVDIDVIQPDAPLMETLELDSLDLVDMVVLVEKNFGFNVTGQDFAYFILFIFFFEIVHHSFYLFIFRCVIGKYREEATYLFIHLPAFGT
jgi:acyl carrier protein